jgi:HAE1 family hydrophobic/amphiphilic exporter-1
MRPILMTAFTTILSMSAIALSQDPGAEMSQGMAVVVIGGLLYATLMTLFIVPTLYDLLYRKAEMKAIDLGDESTL